MKISMSQDIPGSVSKYLKAGAVLALVFLVVLTIAAGYVKGAY